ncbi:MAG: transglutaminase family protein, partial [Magnetospirillum sp.]|nr:transglutaminase family protein [Magnetospirillum sp.]
SLSAQVVRLRPAPHTRTPVLSYSLDIEPKAHFINWQQDPQGNWLARLVFPDKTESFTVDVDLVADLSIINPFDFFLEPAAENFPFQYAPELEHELRPFLACDTAGPLLKDYLSSIPADFPKQTTNFLVALNQRLQADISYTIRMEPGVQTPEQTLESRRGSCRDSAWLLVQMLRRLGLAARFVSGYLIQLVPDVKPLDGPEGPTEDFTDLHAWTEVYLPGAGWIGLDPTSGLLTGEGHIPLAASPDPGSAAPITGAVELCDVGFEHSMSVSRVQETPRVTKPYDEEQWQAVLALGDAVDKRLQAADVRLTQGGEPTFVSALDMEAEEWNVSAVGPTKRAHADELIHRLRDRFSPGAAITFGMGKWYPGESLPRWAFSLIWRDDGEPLWRDQKLIALEKDDHQPTIETARVFMETLSARLGVDSTYANAAYEDTAHYLLREQALPINVDAIDNKLSDPEERSRLAGVFRHGLGTPIGYVLPLQPWQAKDGNRWITEIAGTGSRPKETKNGMVSEIVRTALCVQPREGRINVFLPPVETAEQYLELVGAIEQTAEEMACPVRLEGYAPPNDHRLKMIKVTPDPGVIEVNVHPVSDWRELVTSTEILYHEAHQTRLGTEKFMTDGRHVGTGGGNHMVLGGSTPADSPFLRRPDLLGSLIRFWQNHPSLSYLFSGLFIGPTSQHPRVDEGRDDTLYELELALSQLPPAGAESPPWLVDRILRNVLVDVTGNTHRTEISIDKLYSPDGPTGRLGLVEFRAFEMPPHARMSLVQQLLLRALVARFWDQPYTAPVVRWGSALRDRFMLPHWLEQDFNQVLEWLGAG